MSDTLRVCLIISLLFSIFQILIFYIIEGYLSTFTYIGIVTTLILFFLQIVLIIILSLTKDYQILKVFTVIITTIISLTFFIRIRNLSNYIENGRQMFYELIEKYPDGSSPDEFGLLFYYASIRDGRCCGINMNKTMTNVELVYFLKHFPKNCLFALSSPDPQNPLKGQPCMTSVYNVRFMVFLIHIIQMIIIFLILILSWFYLCSLPRRRNQIIPTFISIPRNQIILHPSNASVYNPHAITPPPTYDYIQQNQIK